MMKKVISWCLYFQEGRRAPEYLFGLRCNQRAARLWFPGWQLRVYVNETITGDPVLFEYVNEIAKNGYPQIEVMNCRDGANPMVERYRVFEDETIDVCIVRDIDSILSKTDADIVNQWLCERVDCDVLRYWEYQMSRGMCMGGGIGVKMRRIQEAIEGIPLTDIKERGKDEQLLEYWVCQIEKERHMVVTTRMLDNGTYCIYQGDANADVKDSEILWTVPFFDSEHGFADSAQINKGVESCVQFCKDQRIRREHTGVHWSQHRETLLNNLKWIR